MPLPLSTIPSLQERIHPFLNWPFDDIEPSLQQVAIEKLLQRECRLEEEEESRRIEANTSDDISIWHEFMQWPETFRGKDLVVRKA